MVHEINGQASHSPKLESHPIAELFPMMDRDSLLALKADIKAHGVQEAGRLYEGKILDGRNRYQACCELGIAMRWQEVGLCDPDKAAKFDPVQHVLSHNLHRRHLTETQREFVAAKIANLKAGDNQHTKEAGQTCTTSKSISDASCQLSVKPRSVKSARAAIKSGCDLLVSKLERGEIRSSTAEKLVKAVPSKSMQRRLLVDGIKSVHAAIRDAEEPKQSSQDQPQPQERPKYPAEHVDSEIFAISKADVAITQLEGIPQRNVHRDAALAKVVGWVQSQAKPGAAAQADRQFLVELRKLFDEMDDFHRQQGMDLWSEWLLTASQKPTTPKASKGQGGAK